MSRPEERARRKCPKGFNPLAKPSKTQLQKEAMQRFNLRRLAAKHSLTESKE